MITYLFLWLNLHWYFFLQVTKDYLKQKSMKFKVYDWLSKRFVEYLGYLSYLKPNYIISSTFNRIWIKEGVKYVAHRQNKNYT